MEIIPEMYDNNKNSIMYGNLIIYTRCQCTIDNNMAHIHCSETNTCQYMYLMSIIIAMLSHHYLERYHQYITTFGTLSSLRPSPSTTFTFKSYSTTSSTITKRRWTNITTSTYKCITSYSQCTTTTYFKYSTTITTTILQSDIFTTNPIKLDAYPSVSINQFALIIQIIHKCYV